MDGNNLHTSVVIELPNDKEPDRVNKFKIDLEDVEASKEYVIDELFCGDDVAVYALFEASEIGDIKSQRHFMTMSNSNFDEEEFRFTHHFGLQKRINKKTYNKHPVINFEESDIGLEHTGDNVNVRKRDVRCKEESPTCAGESGNYVKFESTSTGVNTDIGQSPKLLEEVQKAISLNFSKIDENTELVKNTDLSSAFSVKSSCDFMEIISSTTLGSDGENGENKKSLTSNVVIVPLILKEEKLSHIWKNDQQLPDEESSKISVLEKVSVSTSTDVSSPDNGNSEELKMLQNSHEVDGKLNEEVKSLNSQAYIMEEIKSLQKKFNYLLSSLENIGLTLPKEKESKEIKELQEVKEALEEEESKTIRKTLNKFDDIPIFSRQPYNFSQSKNFDKKLTENEMDEETKPNLSNSDNFIKKLINEIEITDDNVDDVILKDIYDPSKEEEQRPQVINWEEIENYRGTQLSKSQTDVHCFKSKNPPKKSLSTDLGGETIKLKVVENIFFQLYNVKKQKKKTSRQNEVLEVVHKESEWKLHESEKSEVNHGRNSMNTNGLLKFENDKLNKISEKNITEKSTTFNQINQKISSFDSGETKDRNVTKKAGVKSKPEKPKGESKIPYQVFQQKCKLVNRRSMVKQTGQSKLHVDLLIKNSQNSEQKNTIVKPKLPRLSNPKKDHKTIEEEKIDIEPLQELSVRKNLKKKDINKFEIVGPEEALPPTTSEVIVELFSKKPTSVEDFYSEVDLESLYNNDFDSKKNSTFWKTESSDDCKNPVVKSVWALTKVLLYEDGSKKMEVLEASLNPPDYHLSQNLTEDKVR